MASDLGAYLRKAVRYFGLSAGIAGLTITLEPAILGNTNAEVKPPSGIEERLKQAPNPPRRIIYQGGVAYAQGNPSPKTNSVDYESLVLKAEKFGKTKDYQTVIEMLKPYENDPNNKNTAFFNTLGIAYEMTNNFGSAEQSYLMAIHVNEKNVNARVNLGNLYLMTGRKDAARRQFEDTLKVDPTNRFAMRLLEKLNKGQL